MKYINEGNIQIGDGNTIIDIKNGADEKFWRYLEGILSEKGRSDRKESASEKIIEETRSYVKLRDRAGLKAVAVKYGPQFISAILSNIVGEEFGKMMSWIFK